MKRLLAFVLSITLILGNLNAVPVFASSDDMTEVQAEQEIEIPEQEEEIEEIIPQDDGSDSEGSIVLEEDPPEEDILTTGFMDAAFPDPLTELVLSEDSVREYIPEINEGQEFSEADEEPAGSDLSDSEKTEDFELGDPSDPLTLYVNGVKKDDYSSFEEAFKYLSATDDNTIVLNSDFAPAKFTLPTNIRELTIKSKDVYKKTLTLPKIKSLSPDFDLTVENVDILSSGVTTFAVNAKKDLELKNVMFDPRANLSVTAGHKLKLSDDASGIDKISGTKTSELWVKDTVSVKEVATFARIWTETDTDVLKISGKVSGIGTLLGTVHLTSDGETDTAVIDQVENGKLILEYNKSEKALRSKVTVTEVNSSLKIAAVDEETEASVALPSGLPVLTAGGKTIFTDQVTIENTDTDGHVLTAFRYGKEIRAEFANAMTLNGTPYPSFEKAFENLSDEENRLILYTDLAPAKFALPTKKMKSLTIDGLGVVRTITLPKVTSLTASYQLYLHYVDIVSSGATSLAIKAKKDIILADVSFTPVANISVGANSNLYIAHPAYEVGRISGTNSSSLHVLDNVSVKELANFGTVNIYNGKTLTVEGNISGIGKLTGVGGTLYQDALNTSPYTAVINTVENAWLVLDYWPSDQVLASKVIITDVTEKLHIKVWNNGSTKLADLPSGITLLHAGGKTDFANNVKIYNSDTGGHSLKAYKYNKEIRAEFEGALTLTTDSGSKDYPNFEKAFENLSATGDNTINLHTDLAPAKFTFPTKIEKLTIKSDTVGTRRTITLSKIKSLTPKFSLELQDVNIKSNDVTSFTINAKKDLRLSDTSFAPFVNISAAADVSVNLNAGTYGIDKLSGTKSSNLYVSDDIVVYKDVATFGYLFVYPGSTLIVMGKVSGIEKLDGDLWLASAGETDTAAIKTVGTAMLILDYDPAKLSLLSKATVTDVTGALTVKLVDVNNSSVVSALPSGLPILTAGSAKDFTDKITIANKDVDTHALKAYRYGKEIRAEYAGALTLTIGGVSKNYPNFEKAFENLSPDKNNTIELHTDLAPTKFTLPTKIDDLRIESDTPGTRRKLTLPKIKSLTPTFSLTLRDVELESSGVTTFAINAKLGVNIINTTFSPFVSISGGPGVNVEIGNLDDGVYGIENISGTKTTKLFVYDDLVVYGDITTFSELSVWTGKTLKVMGKVSGIEELNKGGNKGVLYLSSAGETDTAVIKNVVNDTTLILDYDPARQALLSKVTVTDVKGTLTIKALDVNDSSKVSALPSGLPILTAGSAKDFTGMITIVNKDAYDHTLTARRYGKEIRAEY